MKSCPRPGTRVKLVVSGLTEYSTVIACEGKYVQVRVDSKKNAQGKVVIKAHKSWRYLKSLKPAGKGQ